MNMILDQLDLSKTDSILKMIRQNNVIFQKSGENNMINKGIIGFQDFLLPILTYVSDLKEHSFKDAYQHCIQNMNLSKEYLKEKIPSGIRSKSESDFRWAKTHLDKALLLSRPQRGVFTISQRGVELLKQKHNRLTQEILLQYPEYRDFSNKNQMTNNKTSLITQDTIENYSINQFFAEVFMSHQQYVSLISRLRCKKNIILQGAPGVGKTYAAKRLAYAMMGRKDNNRVEFIQFHQSYSYEDFIMGYKPCENGFQLQKGIFYLFCEKAAADPENDYFFIIDEINRGNMSKIFGEMLMLIESDHRGDKIKLAYRNTAFGVPGNVCIIGMMNTADRSLAMIDYALRRRFSFFEMEPGFDSDGFKAYQSKINNKAFDALIKCIQNLNRDIAEDNSLGKGFCIGHSYFCNCTDSDNEKLKEIVEHDILPMLAEYWFDEKGKLREWENKLRGVFNER